MSYPEPSASEPEINDPQRAFEELFENDAESAPSKADKSSKGDANEPSTASKGPRVIMSEVPAAFRSEIDAPASAFEVYDWVLRKLEEEPAVTLGELRRRAALVDCEVSEGHFERAQRELLRRQARLDTEAHEAATQGPSVVQNGDGEAQTRRDDSSYGLDSMSSRPADGRGVRRGAGRGAGSRARSAAQLGRAESETKRLIDDSLSLIRSLLAERRNYRAALEEIAEVLGELDK